MTTDIILLTHENLGRALTETASKTFSDELSYITIVPVHNYDDPEHLFQDLDQHIGGSTSPETSYLILTDLFGATPCNIAQRLLERFPDNALAVVTGLNLPMLLKVINYRHEPLSTLTEKALMGGKDGITLCKRNGKQSP